MRETRIYFEINGILGWYSLINNVKSLHLSANLFAQRTRDTRDFFDTRRTPHETVRSAAARYSNPANFRHRPRWVLRMSLINPTLPFFSFTLHHSINKRRRRLRRRILEPVGVRLSNTALHFYPRPVPPRTFLRRESTPAMGKQRSRLGSSEFLIGEIPGNTRMDQRWNDVRNPGCV